MYRGCIRGTKANERNKSLSCETIHTEFFASHPRFERDMEKFLIFFAVFSDGFFLYFSVMCFETPKIVLAIFSGALFVFAKH